MARQARTREEKRERVERLVDEALVLQGSGRFDDWTVSELAGRVGLAKGTVFLYFETKEALGLAMLRRLVGDWLDALDERLAARARALTSGEVAQLMGSTLEERLPLRRMLAILGPSLEHNVGIDRAESYKGWWLERMDRTGALLEAGLPYLRSGEGRRLLMLVQALTVGYNSQAEPAPVVAELLTRPRYGGLRVDFRRALSEALWMQLEGLRAARAPKRRGAANGASEARVDGDDRGGGAAGAPPRADAENS